MLSIDVEELTAEYLAKICEEDEVKENSNVKKVRRAFESRRSKTRRKAQSRQRLEKMMYGKEGLYDKSEDLNPTHYGKFANHARINNFLNRDPYKRHKAQDNLNLLKEYEREIDDENAVC